MTTLRAKTLLLGSAAAGLYLFNALDWFRRGETRLTFWLWISSNLLFLVSLPSWTRRRRPAADRPDDVRRIVAATLLGTILVVALLLRFVNLATLPLDVHGDFASIGLGARDLLEGRVAAFFSSGWADLPWMAFLQPAITMTIFGDNLFGMNMEAVIAGTVTVFGVYLLALRLFDDRALALIAAATSAVGYTEIHFSRVSAYIDPVPWLLFGLIFLVEGLKSGRPTRFGLSGCALAIGFEMYYSGRLVVVVIALYIGYLAIFHRPVLGHQGKGLLLFVAAAVLTLGPYLMLHLRHSASFMDRTRQVYVLSPQNVTHLLQKYGTTSKARMMIEQTWRSVLTFDYTPDSSTQFGFGHPMINPALAPLLVLGVAVGVRRFRHPGHALLVIWLTTGVVLGSILTIDAPFWPRLVVLLPAVAILVAIALVMVLRALIAWLGGRPSPAALLLPAAVFLFAVGYENWRWYFRSSLGTFAAPIAWVGRLVGQSPPGTRFCMILGPLDFADRVPQFLGKGRDMLSVPPENLEEYQQRCFAEGRVWVIIRPDHDSLLASLGRRWPSGRVEPHDYPSGEPGPIFWYPPTGPRAVSPSAPIPARAGSS